MGPLSGLIAVVKIIVGINDEEYEFEVPNADMDDVDEFVDDISESADYVQVDIYE